MSIKKKLLIITDGTELIDSIAHSLKTALKSTVKISRADVFDGTDLLASDTFFIGCEKPNPSSFKYLEEMLEHINLVERHCGIFSANKKTLKYLSGILKGCDAKVGEPLLITEPDAKAVNNWLKGLWNN